MSKADLNSVDSSVGTDVTQSPATPVGAVEYPSPSINPDTPDVPKRTLLTLAQHMSRLTTVRQAKSPPGTATDNVLVNAYPVDIPTTNVVKIDLSTPSTGDHLHAPELNEAFGADNVEGLSKGERTIKGKTRQIIGDRVGGHEYLRNAGTADAKDRASGVGEVPLNQPNTKFLNGVLANNRFTVGSPFTADVPLKIGNTTYSRDKLSNVGLTLTTRASTEMGANSAGYNASSGGAQVKAILPGWNQLGANPVQLETMDALSALIDSGESGPEEIDVLAPGVTDSRRGSWGQMNNPIDQYTGMSAFGMTALSISLFFATNTVLLGFKTVLKLVMKTSDGDRDPATLSDSGRHFLGTYGPRKSAGTSGGFPPIPMDSNFVANLMGLRQTNHDWSKCVEAGMLRFYGSSKTELGLMILFDSESLTRAIESPGYYSVVSRSIVRSAVTIVSAFNDIISSFGADMMSGIKSLISFFEVIKSSKFMAALNVFASIGDTVLSRDDDQNTSDSDDPNRTSALDAMDNQTSSQTKHRLKGPDGKQSLKLSWSANRAVSLLATPDVVRGAMLQGFTTNGPAALMGVPSDMSRTIYTRKDGRIPSETVQYIEGVLDSEYVPFYFHDLRTNEILSFHAFIASISDEYAPAWESIESPGRIDPIKIYKNTSRKIGLSFYVVSTSNSDFEEMWTKINKLTTLVYPSYTLGRVVSDSEENAKNRMVVPFSQLMSASPLVRIRLGDLFRSNYSKFALARLFGMGSMYAADGAATDMKLQIDGESILTQPTTATADQRMQDAAQRNFDAGISDVVYLMSSNDIKAENMVTLHDKNDLMRDLEKVKGAGQNIPVVFDDTKFTVKVTTTRAADILAVDSLAYKFVQKWNGTKIFSSEHKLINVATEIARHGYSGADGATHPKFQNFMSEDNNSIVHSFKQTGGKGLAGAIESLSFDWYDRVNWETSIIGSKAPQTCKVSLTFSPIHDIPPGLDHNGYNRAPLYPIGSNDGESYGKRRSPSTLSSDSTNKNVPKSASTK